MSLISSFIYVLDESTTFTISKREKESDTNQSYDKRHYTISEENKVKKQQKDATKTSIIQRLWTDTDTGTNAHKIRAKYKLCGDGKRCDENGLNKSIFPSKRDKSVLLHATGTCNTET